MHRIKIQERGIAGHFCGWTACHYRRNTLIEYRGIANEPSTEQRVVVSSIGDYWLNEDYGQQQIGYERYYETMAFMAKLEENSWVADINKQITFDSSWHIEGTKPSDIPKDVHNLMDTQHDAVVHELKTKLLNNEPLNNGLLNN